MVKLIENSRSADGFPSVRWEQEVPTGQSQHAAEQSIAVKIGVVIMVFVFVAVYASSEQFWGAIFAALVVGGMVLGGDKMFKGGIKVWDLHIPGPEPGSGTAEAEQRARATAMLGREYCQAMVRPHGEARELYFWVYRGLKPDKLEAIGGVPLSSIQSFEVGTAEEWFMDLAQAQLRRTSSAPNSWVIVAPSLGEGVLWIAESAGAKAPIAALHGLLTKLFVIEAPEMQERWKAKLEEAARDKPNQKQRAS